MKKLGIAFLLASMTFLGGCDLQLQEASARIKLTLFELLELEAEGKWKRDEQQQQRMMQAGVSSLAFNSYIDVTAENAYVPDQSATATVSVKSPSGALIAAQSFGVNVVSNRVGFANPSAVEQWLANYDYLDEGSLAIAVPDLAFDAPSEGYYTLTNETFMDGTEVASASVTGYVDPGGWTPPTDPK